MEFELDEYIKTQLDDQLKGLSDKEKLQYLSDCDVRLATYLEDSEIECAKMLFEQKVDRIASRIRIVVVGVVTINHNPYPHIYKRTILGLRTSHSEVLSVDRAILEQAIATAQDDMFAGEFQLQEYIKEAHAFFLQYTSDPTKLNIDRLKYFIAEKYRADVEELF